MNRLQLTLFLTLLGASLSPAEEPFAEAEPVPDYIRYQAGGDEGKHDILETAVSRFEKGDMTVDLIAMVHLGDAEYFQRLNQALESYDTVLYEMVGGPYTREKARLSREAVDGDSSLAQVHNLQNMAKSLLGLEFQLDGIDYFAENFVHADMTEEQFMEATGGGDAVLSDMLARAMKVAQAGQLPGLPSSEAESNQMMMLMFGALMSGDSNLLKRSLGPILAEAETFIARMEEDEGSVLISQRNKIVIEKIEETEMTTAGESLQVAVIYGAGHMPDLENRLEALGYQKTRTVWEPSWLIGPGPSENGNAPAIQDMMNQVGGLMKLLEGEEEPTKPATEPQ